MYLKEREERLKRQQEEKEKEEEKEEDDEETQKMKELMGFGGFGTSKKKLWTCCNKHAHLPLSAAQIGTAVKSGSFSSSAMKMRYICSIDDPLFEFHSSTYFFRNADLIVTSRFKDHSGWGMSTTNPREMTPK